jgi:hypothetical protein
LTPKITISKTCASISKSYTHSLTFHAKKDLIAVSLPFLNIGAKDGCGIQKIDLAPSNKDVITQAKGKAGCPGVLCNSVHIDTNRPGTYTFYARATLNDKSTITTQKYSVRVICDKNLNRLSRGSLSSPTVHIGSKYLYEFGAFKATGSESCGFKQPYLISVIQGDKTKLKYPPTGTSSSTCKSFNDCRKIEIDTSRKNSLYFRVYNINLAGYATYGYARVTVTCGPKSSTITPTNAVGNGSPMTLDAAKPNYLIQSIAQDQRYTTKWTYLNRISQFKWSAPDCPIVRYELVNPSRGVRQAYVGVSTRIYFSVADKTPQTFQIKATAVGGAIYVTPKITINKTCASIKTTYTRAYNNYYAKTGGVAVIELPFMNIGAKDGCGVNKMEVVNGNGVFALTKNKRYSGCPGVLCRFVEVSLSKAGSFTLYAKASLNDKSSLSM